MDNQLASKIAKAALDVGGRLSADKRNEDQKYDYISADKILSVCGQALSTQGIVIIPEIANQKIDSLEYVNQYNKTVRRYDGQVDFLFKITDGTTELSQKWVGLGSDYSTPDKAIYKAITSGHKYFLAKLLCIGAGNEDGEHETSDGSGEESAMTTTKSEEPAPVVPEGFEPYQVDQKGNPYDSMNTKELAYHLTGLANRKPKSDLDNQKITYIKKLIDKANGR
jgi:hypothetical protein